MKIKELTKLEVAKMIIENGGGVDLYGDRYNEVYIEVDNQWITEWTTEKVKITSVDFSDRATPFNNGRWSGYKKVGIEV